MSYETRRDYAHALQCLQQARSLASGPLKSSIDRLIARLEQNMGRYVLIGTIRPQDFSELG